MSDRLGAPVTKDIVDAQASQLITDLLRAWRAALDWNTEFLNKTAAVGTGTVDLTRFPEVTDTTQQYTSDQIADIRNQYGALAALWEVANGRASQASPSNFFFWKAPLVGTNVVSMNA